MQAEEVYCTTMWSLINFWSLLFGTDSLTMQLCLPNLGSLTSAIRNYAKCLESWLVGSLTDIPQKMVDLKVIKTIKTYTVDILSRSRVFLQVTGVQKNSLIYCDKCLGALLYINVCFINF